MVPKHIVHLGQDEDESDGDITVVAEDETSDEFIAAAEGPGRTGGSTPHHDEIELLSTSTMYTLWNDDNSHFNGSVYRWLRLRDDTRTLRGCCPEPGNNMSHCFTEMKISRQQMACTMPSRIQETGYLPVSQCNICMKLWGKHSMVSNGSCNQPRLPRGQNSMLEMWQIGNIQN
jgi:hypothetical protein